MQNGVRLIFCVTWGESNRENLMRSMVFVLVSIVASTVGCASTPGAQPHDMSATQHEVMSSGEEKVAAAHAVQYDTSAKTEKGGRCSGGGARDGAGDGACWTSVSNPTAEHLVEAERHRKMAADHRAASKALRDAEASACVGLSDQDRDMSPFSHREDIAGVEPLTSGGRSRSLPTTVGAVITFRATPGMTTQWLQRLVDCHLARSAAMGHDVPEMAYCPLMPKSTTARVVARDAGFAVEVRSDDSESVKEIIKRAQALVGR